MIVGEAVVGEGVVSQPEEGSAGSGFVWFEICPATGAYVIIDTPNNPIQRCEDDS